MSDDYADYEYYMYDDGDYTLNGDEGGSAGFTRELPTQFVPSIPTRANYMYQSRTRRQTVQRVLELGREVGAQIGYENALAECIAFLSVTAFDVFKASRLPFDGSPLAKNVANGDNNSDHYLAGWDSPDRGHLVANDKEAECVGCWNELAAGEGRAFCCHYLCKECWEKKLNVHRTQDWGNSKLVLRCEDVKRPTCLGMAVIPIIEAELRSFVGRLFMDPFLEKHESQWCRLLPEIALYPGKTAIQAQNTDGTIRSTEFTHSRFVACSTDGCGGFFEVDGELYSAKSSLHGAVAGECGGCSKRTCFMCHSQEHSPASCAAVALWRAKESEVGHWVLAHTKACPACNSMIEKDGGCDHMTCRMCRHEFCWICMVLWSEHNGSKCNGPSLVGYGAILKAGADADAEEARASPLRFKHYYNRFRNHMDSVRRDEAAVGRFVIESFGENMSYLDGVAKTLFDCRYTLANTYVYAYFETDSGAIFEFNQWRLEHATEELSRIVETCQRGGKIGRSQQDILNKAFVAKKYLEILRTGI